MDYLHWVLTAVTTLFGGTAFFQFFAYRKQEVSKRDIANMQATIGMLQGQIEWTTKRLEELQKMIVDKDAYISQLSGDKSTLEIKNAKNKGAINKAFSCNYCDVHANCPVLIQRSVHEEEYLKRIDNVDIDSN